MDVAEDAPGSARLEITDPGAGTRPLETTIPIGDGLEGKRALQAESPEFSGLSLIQC
jgi:hypothetical protein